MEIRDPGLAGVLRPWPRGRVLFLLTLWKDIRRPEPSGNLHGILAPLLVVAIGVPAFGLIEVAQGPIAKWHPIVVVFVWFPAVLWLQWSGGKRGSPASQTCAKIATVLFLLLLFGSTPLPAQAT